MDEKDHAEEARRDVVYAQSWQPGGANYATMIACGNEWEAHRERRHVWARATSHLLAWLLSEDMS